MDSDSLLPFYQDTKFLFIVLKDYNLFLTIINICRKNHQFMKWD